MEPELAHIAADLRGSGLLAVNEHKASNHGFYIDKHFDILEEPIEPSQVTYFIPVWQGDTEMKREYLEELLSCHKEQFPMEPANFIRNADMLISLAEMYKRSKNIYGKPSKTQLSKPHRHAYVRTFIDNKFDGWVCSCGRRDTD